MNMQADSVRKRGNLVKATQSKHVTARKCNMLPSFLAVVDTEYKLNLVQKLNPPR